MLDWFTGLVGYDASNLALGKVRRFDPLGEIVSEWETWEQAVGSHDTKIQVCRTDSSLQMVEHAIEYGFLCSPYVLKISGNPTKFLQGHNLAGPSVSLLGPVLQATARKLPEVLRPRDCDSDLFPSVHRSRVDITLMIDLGNHETVHEWLSHAEAETRKRKGGRPQGYRGIAGKTLQSVASVYWGIGSSRWTMKAYCKRCELLAHPQEGFMNDEILDWAGRILRLELELKRPELKDRGTLDESLIWEFFKRIEVGVMKGDSMQAMQLPREARGTYFSWLAGCDVHTDRSVRTFYRQRRQIKDVMGVDISSPPSEQIQKQDNSFDRNLFDTEVLKSKVANDYPNLIQQTLFEAETPVYEKSGPPAGGAARKGGSGSAPRKRAVGRKAQRVREKVG